MPGLSETLGSPWPPLAIRLCQQMILNKQIYLFITDMKIRLLKTVTTAQVPIGFEVERQLATGQRLEVTPSDERAWRFINIHGSIQRRTAWGIH
jgi:hypothetical protein